jgi:hypothetical protein
MLHPMALSIPLVPSRVETVDPASVNRVGQALLSGRDEEGLALAWAERFRRFIEVHRPNLRTVARDRFGYAEAGATLGTISDVLCAAAVRRVLANRRISCF